MKNFLNLSSIITYIDLFGQGINLRIDKKEKSKTIFGGLLTMIMLILLFFMFFFSAQDVLYHTNPQISLEQQINSNMSALFLDKNTMPISISLTLNGNFALYKPEYFNYYFSVRYGETTAESLTEHFYNLTQCRKELFPRVTQEAYDKLNMNQNLCIDRQNITLSGGWSDASISYLSIRIAICTDSENCAKYEEILDYLKSNTFFWNLYYMNTNVNPQNYLSPISYNIVNYYKLIKLGSYKMTELYIRPQTLKSDSGFLFESNIYTDTVAFDYDNYDDSSIDDSQTLVDFQIYLSPNKFIYHRNYRKIQEVLASVGGLANILRIAFLIICYIFSIVKRDEIILNKIFEFDLTENNEFQQNRNVYSSFIEQIKNKSSNEIHNMSNERKEQEEQNTRIHENKKHMIINLDESAIKDAAEGQSINTNQNTKMPINMNYLNETIFSNTIISSKIDFTSDTSINKKANFCRSSTLFSANKFKSKIFKGVSENKDPLQQSKIANRNIMIPGIFKPSAISPEHNSNSKTENKKSLKNNKSSKQKRLAVQPLNKIKSTNSLQEVEESEAKKIISIFEQRNKKKEIKFSFCETITAFLCCKNCMGPLLTRKKKLYDRSNIVINEFLDITFIVHKLEEFEKFKMTAFSREQLALFNFISKELISLDDIKTQAHGMTSMKTFNKDKENMVNVILKFKEKLKNSEQIDPIDIKLFELINEEFK